MTTEINVNNKEPIRGKVASILNTRELVINRGSSDGVKKDMVFAVLDSDGREVFDPETGERLGSIEREKVLVKAKVVTDKLTVARTFQYRMAGGGGAFVGVASLFEPRRRVYDSLEADSSWYAELDERDSYVHVGDPVRQVEDFDDETRPTIIVR